MPLHVIQLLHITTVQIIHLHVAENDQVDRGDRPLLYVVQSRLGHCCPLVDDTFVVTDNIVELL